MKRRHRRGRQPWRPELSVAQILAWIDRHHRLTGEWPTSASGRIAGTDENWANMDTALRQGRRGLLPGSSLARLLTEHRGVRNPKVPPPLHVRAILAWAKAQRRRTGALPTADSGPIPEAPGETWMAVNQALALGRRRLPGGSSLAQLLAAECGHRNIQDLPPLTVPQILRWADAWHRRTGQWPRRHSGAIPEAPGETWSAVDAALYAGVRSLENSITLARLLFEQRGVPHQYTKPKLTIRAILVWMADHRRCTGMWPRQKSGVVAAAPDETWAAIDNALARGLRGLPGGSSLALLRDRHSAQRAGRRFSVWDRGISRRCLERSWSPSASCRAARPAPPPTTAPLQHITRASGAGPRNRRIPASPRASSSACLRAQSSPAGCR